MRRGDLVEVRSAAEILATLDEQATFDHLPFMREMIAYCGCRFRVAQRATKVCDTVNYWGSRRLQDTVLLEDLRCNGTSHGGCQAMCRLYWKEAWLREAADSGPGVELVDHGAAEALKALTERNSHDTRGVGCYDCQATRLLDASSQLRRWDPRPFLTEYTSGNVNAARLSRVTLRALIEETRRKLGRFPDVFVKGDGSSPTKRTALNLEAGEWVEVRPRPEIEATLTVGGTNRGLSFDREMLAFCGQRFRVQGRVHRIIDERTGRMIELQSDCVLLDGPVCSGDFSIGRWLCPRAIYPYWRECWLKRVDGPLTEPEPTQP